VYIILRKGIVTTPDLYRVSTKIYIFGCDHTISNYNWGVIFL